ncbi:hypothetical protein ACVRWQ_05950 [Streptococcus phocae subsp. salmonis]|uniref:hypothetical protein n=1 Tax=Streptococcus phocae TaxID=119224 RepID=UPI00068CEC19|nr:hypothetical protein [Streptococcus phocae]QBX27832.1 hypothetical protein Javan420_0032 [Streptococcus phage Javan420]
MKISKLKTGDKVWVRGSIDYDGDLVFGYTIKEEKLYKVRDKRLQPDSNCLNFDKVNKSWFFSNSTETKIYKTKHTRKKLEESGFNVFDDDNYEIAEV